MYCVQLEPQCPVFKSRSTHSAGDDLLAGGR
jgi:hypothetical protein